MIGSFHLAFFLTLIKCHARVCAINKVGKSRHYLVERKGGGVALLLPIPFSFLRKVSSITITSG